jgi:coenzyme F420 hydrogenase subunit beta
METSRGLDQLRRSVLERGLCAACGACVGICPYVTAFKGQTVLLDGCSVEYGRCFAYCPMVQFDSEKAAEFVFGSSENTMRLGHVRSVVASRSLNPHITSVAQGGGTVSTVLARALEDQAIEAAILTGLDAEHRYPCGKVATNLHEILTCTGSKYVGAHSLSAFRQAIDMGYQRIGVVGLPCQVRALRKMALHDLKNENLNDRIRLVVGLFCNWAFSSRDFEAFLSRRFNVQTIKKLHIPPPPANVLELETYQGEQIISLDEIRPLIQGACWNCPDMTSEYADVSVGMYEGRAGWNTLIVRTGIGQDVVESAKASGWLETEPFPQANLEHLEKASISKKKRHSV